VKSYRFVDGEYTIKYEIKKSIFIASIKGEVDDDSAETFVKSIKKKYSDATHNCYAYISDAYGNATRFSDDGEPSGTAGAPILEVIKKKGLTKTCIVVTRYFGGIKLGAGGLVGAYTEAAVESVDSAKVSEKFESKEINISTDYSTWSILEKNIRKANAIVNSINYGDNVESSIFVKLDDVDRIKSLIDENSQGKAFYEECAETLYVKFE